MTRIFGWSADPGTRYWRLDLPLGELAKRSHDVMVDDKMPPAVMHESYADVVVASRTCMEAASATFRRLASEGRMLCVYETDDDAFTVTPDNRPAHRLFVQQRSSVSIPIGLNHYASVDVDVNTQANIEANLAAAHLVTTTNRHLADRLAQRTDAPVVILPNRVPRWLAELPAPWERPSGPVVVGHTGGASHVRDVGECAKPLRSWLQRLGNAAELRTYGLDWTDRVRTNRSRTSHVPWQGSVPAYLRSLVGVDIGLAPLRDTEFSRSKSPLKAMEWGALGIPVIASNCGPYADYVRHGETGFLCSTHKEWGDALGALTDSGLRYRMGMAGRAQAREHLIEDHAHEWLDAYTGAMGQRAAA